jgi:hypothetical protein
VVTQANCGYLPDIQDKRMNKIMLAMAAVATLGLSTAVFAQSPTPSIKKRVQPAQSQASVGDKMRVSHRVGSKKFVLARL